MKQNDLRSFARDFNRPWKAFSYEKALETVLPLFEETDSPTSLGLWLCLKYDPRSYLEYNFDPSRYDDAVTLKQDYACAEILRKADFLPVDIDPREEAVKSFITAESLCHDTNTRLSYGSAPRSAAVSNVSYIAMRKIRRILGKCPSLDDIETRFGPGNNIGVVKNTNIIDKVDNVPTVAGELLAHEGSWRINHPSWAAYITGSDVHPPKPSIEIARWKAVAGSKLGFVPKSAKTDRPICTEPLINGVYQNGIGDLLVKKLRRAGCDLRSQERNQELARIGSITGQLATIDLKAASDTISLMTVFDLLPEDWFELLNITRSKSYTYMGGTYDFRKFSSMGNGFTFPLESLIFLTLTRACCDHLGIPDQDVSVYGDDIVCPVPIVPLLREVFDWYGFTINEDKSHYTGFFRESCGHDFFKGIFVRPIYIKERFSPAYIISRANLLYTDDYYWHQSFRGMRAKLLSWLPNYVRKKLVGPPGFGDGHIHVPFERRYLLNRGNHRRAGDGWEGFPYYTVSTSPFIRIKTHPGVFVAALYHAQSCGSGKTEPVTRNGMYAASTRRRFFTKLKKAYHPWYVPEM